MGRPYIIAAVIGAVGVVALLVYVAIANPFGENGVGKSDEGILANAPSDSSRVPARPAQPDSVAAPLWDLQDDTKETPPPELEMPAPDITAPLLIPVQGIKPEELLDTFNKARSQGREHNAIDIIAPRGTPVLAAADGHIVELFNSDKGGITIYQMAPDRKTVYYYAHLDRYADGIKEGLAVQRGEIIGYVGDTGNAVPGNYHLHFAIWTTSDPNQYWDGENVNPYPLLRGNNQSDYASEN